MTVIERLNIHIHRVIKQNFERLGYKQSPVLCPAKNATKILCNVLYGTDKPGSKENSEEVQATMKAFKAAKVSQKLHVCRFIFQPLIASLLTPSLLTSFQHHVTSCLPPTPEER
jgi:hypothetical protein